MIRPVHLREKALGYAPHTNRELGLMLRGEKPLAVFSETDGDFVDCIERYLRLFDRYIESGRFIRRDIVEFPKAGRSLHTVLIAQSAQAWRIEAMIDLRRHLDAWTDEHEREEGRLLGYEEWQNDIWIARRTKSRAC